ncbi:hypothetical protein NPIL_306671 [Nephila pilipes]|uniref:Uncharacterized protein n=1 Tax=Nephila pilipes TaxID=299642 RepID=A0A8X6U737_NEPPI|nr:hypothetical protein NPIL_306671 [Nephila pilipes]
MRIKFLEHIKKNDKQNCYVWDLEKDYSFFPCLYLQDMTNDDCDINTRLTSVSGTSWFFLGFNRSGINATEEFTFPRRLPTATDWSEPRIPSLPNTL